MIYAAGEGSFTQSDKKKLRREAAALAKVSSPHVVGLRGQTVVTDFVCCLVMEHLDSESLDKLLEQAGAGIPAMNEATALSCLKDVLKGLQAIHLQDLVHRDVKPGNIIVVIPLQGLARYVLIDLGIVVLTEAADAQWRTTTARTTVAIVGTPQYMSPEAIADPQSVDRKTDLYSLGVTMYHLVSGLAPHEGANFAMITNAILSKDARPLSELRCCSRAFSCLVEQAMRKDLEDRFQSAEEMLSYIDNNFSDVLGDDYDKIIAALQAHAGAVSERLVGDLNDLKSGKFEDAAHGLRAHLKVGDDWSERDHCTVEGMTAEIQRLCDCPDCARRQATVLEDLGHAEHADLTRNLAASLVRLTGARRNGFSLPDDAMMMLWSWKRCRWM